MKSSEIKPNEVYAVGMRIPGATVKGGADLPVVRPIVKATVVEVVRGTVVCYYASVWGAPGQRPLMQKPNAKRHDFVYGPDKTALPAVTKRNLIRVSTSDVICAWEDYAPESKLDGRIEEHDFELVQGVPVRVPTQQTIGV